MRIRSLLALPAVVLIPIAVVADDERSVEQESTAHRDADAVQTLIAEQRFQAAITLCEKAAQDIERHSDAAATWAIRHSQVLTAREMLQDRFGAEQIRRAAEPVAQLLAAYPNHRRALFLQAQQVDVRAAAAAQFVVQASITPDPETKDVAISQLLKVTTAYDQLAGQIDRFRAQLDHSQSANRRLDLDLSRLKQQLSVKIVSQALLQTELFPSGSDDCIAAATAAEQVADQAIQLMAAGTEPRRELQRLKIEAILRAAQPDRAAHELDAVLASAKIKRSPAWLSLQVRVRNAQGKQAEAEQLLQSFYHGDPASGPRSTAMDLALLDHMLRFEPESMGAWFDQIERRSGSFARRRAESIVLSRPESTDAEAMIPPAVLAARGRSWIRRGETQRGAELLGAAAAAEADHDRALQHATQAAAALSALERWESAATVLLETALSHPTGEHAANTHLQGIFLLAKSSGPDVESRLRTQLAQWPVNDSAVTARHWLNKLLTDQGQLVAAAELMSDVPPSELTDNHVAAIRAAWRSVFHQLPDDQFQIATRRFHDATRPLRGNPRWQSEFRLIAATLLQRDALAGLPEPASNEHPFVAALIQFRILGTSSDAVVAVPDQLVDEASWRLIRDGRVYPQLRRPVANLLQQWDADGGSSFTAAECLLWAGKTEEAIAMLHKIVDQSDDSTEASKLAARLLETADSPRSRAEAIHFWDRLASGTPKQSSLWHESRLAAIRLLREAGQHQQAIRRARYVLLTTPNIDRQWRKQYEATIK